MVKDPGIRQPIVEQRVHPRARARLQQPRGKSRSAGHSAASGACCTTSRATSTSASIAGRAARRSPSSRSAELRLEIEPRLADQGLRVGTRYWEGAVAVTGSSGRRAIGGRG